MKMELNEAIEILKENDCLIKESAFDGIYGNSVFDAVFNMPADALKEFFNLCRQVNRYGQTKKQYAYEMAVVKFGDKFAELIKQNG